MINKKYRPVKIWGWLLVLVMASFGLLCLPIGLFRSVIVGICCVVLFLSLILMLTYHIEVKEDRLIVRYSTSSDYNREYFSMFKTHTFLFDDIRNLDVYDDGKYKRIQIILKTGDSVSFSAVGFLNRDYAEIKSLIFDVKKTICESQIKENA